MFVEGEFGKAGGAVGAAGAAAGEFCQKILYIRVIVKGA